MDRRESLKSIVLGSIAGSLVLNGCKPEIDPETGDIVLKEKHFGRTPKEKELIEEVYADEFLNEHEITTITTLSLLILPPNENGGPIEAEVPEFIDFITKDIPGLQTPIRGGLMWLDHKSNTLFDKEFNSITEAQQKEILDTIAFYNPEVPMNKQPLEIQFFAMMRNLTLTGYYTSKVGIKDLGYKGNTPNIWDGVPQDVLDQHGFLR